MLAEITHKEEIVGLKISALGKTVFFGILEMGLHLNKKEHNLKQDRIIEEEEYAF